jgi:hypothetical protein
MAQYMIVLTVPCWWFERLNSILEKQRFKGFVTNFNKTETFKFVVLN